MRIIKLDAIDSTNDYLKQLARETLLENYTVVMAKEQTKGKGQMGAKWLSESGKNLTMSVLINDARQFSESIFDFNVAITLSIVTVLQQLKIPNVQIKWPNDIMADSRKVGGILIENVIKSEGGYISVVGIGLNLNQTNFDGLPNASSLTLLTNKEYDPEAIAKLIVTSNRNYLPLLQNHPDLLWEYYEDILFKKNTPCTFENDNSERFMGVIQNVSREGKLLVRLSDDIVASFAVKEVKMLY